MSLFRNEVVENKKSKLMGEVIATVPIPYSIIIFILFGIFIASGVFMATHDIYRSTKVSGFLEPEGGLIKVRTESNSMVSKLYVSLGDKVSKDQKLVKTSSPKKLVSGAALLDELKESIGNESKSIRENINVLENQIIIEQKLLSTNIEKLDSQEKLLLESIEFKKSKILLAEEKIENIEDLASKGFTNNTEYDQSKLLLLQYREEHLQTKNEQNTINKEKHLVSKQHEKVINQIREGILAHEQRLQQIQQQLITHKIASGQLYTSPIDGIVTGVFVKEGSINQAGTVLISIKSLNSNLMAKLSIPSSSIGMLKQGQSVSIKYDAFPYQRFGVFEGAVVDISGAPILPGESVEAASNEEPLYDVYVALATQEVNAYGKMINLVPGLNLQAEIKIEKLTILESILDPLRSFK